MTDSVYFFDSRLTQLDALLAALPEGSLWYVIEPDRNGVEQLRDILDGMQPVDAVHIVSHGASGHLLLGSTLLDTQTLLQQATDWAQIGSRLSADGDILIYGCDVALGTEGVEFIETLAWLTDADVAASDDLTGNVGLGGDWELELRVGQLDTSREAWDANLLQVYSGLLLAESEPNNTQATADAMTLGSAISGQ